MLNWVLSVHCLPGKNRKHRGSSSKKTALRHDLFTLQQLSVEWLYGSWQPCHVRCVSTFRIYLSSVSMLLFLQSKGAPWFQSRRLKEKPKLFAVVRNVNSLSRVLLTYRQDHLVTDSRYAYTCVHTVHVHTHQHVIISTCQNCTLTYQ